MELDSFHSAGAQNFEVVPRFLEKFIHKSLHRNFGTSSLPSFNLCLVTVLVDFSDWCVFLFCYVQCGQKIYLHQNISFLPLLLLQILEQRQALYAMEHSSPLSVAQHGDVLSISLEEFIQPVVHNRVRIPQSVVCGFSQQLGKWAFVWGLSYQLSAWDRVRLPASLDSVKIKWW
jgi:hypothetical protein